MSLDRAQRNRVLSSLSDADLDLIRDDLIAIDLPKRHRLSQANVPMDRVYFLESGIASVVARYQEEVPIEIGIIGREGLVNHPVILQADRSPNATYMQLGGAGHGIDARLLVVAMAASASLERGAAPARARLHDPDGVDHAGERTRRRFRAPRPLARDGA